MKLSTIKFIKFRGFSLIELMVVVAIIGVLSMIALPAYDGYMVRAKISHITAVADGMKKGITEYRALNGAFPPTIAEAYRFSTDKYVRFTDFPAGNLPCTNILAFKLVGQNIFGNANSPIVKYKASYSSGAITNNVIGIEWTCEYYLNDPSSQRLPANTLAECTAVTAAITEDAQCS